MKPTDPSDPSWPLAGQDSNREAPWWQDVFWNTPVPLWLHDISDMRRAVGEVLAMGIKDFPGYLDAHPEFVLQVLDKMKVLDVNAAAVERFGARDKDELLFAMDRLLVPESLAGIKDFLRAVAMGEDFFEGEVQYQTLDGRRFHAWSSARIPGPDDPFNLMVLATTDITDFKMEMKTLAGNAERYRLVVEAARDIILRHDLDGKITFINQAGLEISGYVADEIIGKSIFELAPSKHHPAIERRGVGSNHDDSGVSLYEIELLTKDGHLIPLEVSSTLISESSTSENGPQVLVLGRDIADRKREEKQRSELDGKLRDAQKLESLGILAGGLAHDFNNLLVAIMGNAELAREDMPEGMPAIESLDTIQSAANQAADLCRQMLAYAGKGEFSVEPVDIGSVVRGISGLLQVSVTGKAEIIFDLGEGLPFAQVDVHQFRQVVMNLITNAAESLGEEGGEIVMRTGSAQFDAEMLRDAAPPGALAPGHYVFCQVRDSGCGMDEATASRLFDPFFTTKFAGRGLGMAAALGILRGHGGGFLLDTVPGRGTTITCLLPAQDSIKDVTEGQKPKAVEKDEARPDLTGRTVLVVDDDHAVRWVGEGFLRRLGCKVLSATDGFEAVRIFGQRYREIDIVLLDVTMAGMDGVATCRRLKVIRPDVKVVLTSGYNEDDVMSRSSGLEPAGFVPKPFTLAQMADVLGRAIGPAS